MKPATLLLGICLWVWASSASAQQHLQLRPEQRVRVRAPESGLVDPIAAAVMAVQEDSILLQIEGMQRSIPIATITDLEVSRGKGSRRKHALTGALLGTGVGVGAAVIHRLTTPEDSVETGRREVCTSLSCGIVSEWEAVPYRTGHSVGITLTGTILGALAGALFPADRWERVAVQPGTAFVGGSHAVAIAFSFRF